MDKIPKDKVKYTNQLCDFLDHKAKIRAEKKLTDTEEIAYIK